MEYKDSDQRKQLDRDLEQDPVESRSRPSPELMALIAATRMPQAVGMGESTWKPGDKRGG